MGKVERRGLEFMDEIRCGDLEGGGEGCIFSTAFWSFFWVPFYLSSDTDNSTLCSSPVPKPTASSPSPPLR